MSAAVDFCGNNTRLRRDYLGVPAVEGHGSRQGDVGSTGHSVWKAKLNSWSSSSSNTIQLVLLYFLTYGTDIQTEVRDGRVVGQQVSGALRWGSGTSVYLRTFLLPRFSAPSVPHPQMRRKTPPVFWYAAEVMNPGFLYVPVFWIQSLAVFGRQRTGPRTGGQVALARSHPRWEGSPPDGRLVSGGGGWHGPKTRRRQAIEQCAAVLKLASFLTFI